MSDGVYEYFYFDERRAKRDAKKIRGKGAKSLRRLTKRKKDTKELNTVIVTTEVTIQSRSV